MAIKWRHQHDDEADEAVRKATRCSNCEPSKTQQHFTKEVDINNIVRRFGLTDGAIPTVALDPTYYGDFSEAADFRTALDRTRDATERFQALPANVRSRFNNDPVQLWHFVNKQENAEEAVKLGILKRRVEEKKVDTAVSPST